MPNTIGSNTSGHLFDTSFTTEGVLYSAASGVITSTAAGSSGQVFQSTGNATAPAYSTSTFPSVATGTGTILRADGTNWVATTNTYPNTSAINTVLVATSANVIGNTSAFKITSDVVTNTAQPAFLAAASLQSDVTGDNTAYTILYANEIFDQASNFNPATGIFTAPVAGRYQINVTTALSGLGVANTTGTVSIVATSRTIAINAYNWGVVMSAGTVVRACGSVLLDMAANDTCKVVATITGGTKVVDVLATDTTFSGYLVC